jgi:hypothetical protein
VQFLRSVAVDQGTNPDKFVRVLAPTGTAAFNVKGMTLHGEAH